MDVLAHHGLAALAAAGRQIAGESGLDASLATLAEAAAAATAADVAVIRVVDDAGDLRLRAVVATSQALSAELAGSRFRAAELPEADLTEIDALPQAVRSAAARAGAEAVFLAPVWIAGRAAGSLELLRDGEAFTVEELSLARLAAAQLTLTLIALGERNGSEPGIDLADRGLALAGDALGAGLDAARVADQVAFLAADATG